MTTGRDNWGERHKRKCPQDIHLLKSSLHVFKCQTSGSANQALTLKILCLLFHNYKKHVISSIFCYLTSTNYMIKALEYIVVLSLCRPPPILWDNFSFQLAKQRICNYLLFLVWIHGMLLCKYLSYLTERIVTNKYTHYPFQERAMAGYQLGVQCRSQYQTWYLWH